MYTNSNCNHVINDLISIMKDANIDVRIERRGISIGGTASKHKITMNKSTFKTAQSLCEILGPYLQTKYEGKPDNKMENGIIDIEFYGTPIFNEDGSVKFNQ